jgi:RNA polymerase sigma factor (sigma-70 family)
MGMTSDAQLLALAERDPLAFRELYDRYAERIHGYHLRRTGGADSALDLTAETFARAWLGRGRFRDEADGSAAPWLFAIARNVLLESVRRRTLELGAVERLRLERPRPEVTPQDSWLDGADELLDGLPPAQREALRLRVIDDLSYDGVAARLRTTPAAARVRVHRGLGALRARLSKKTTEELPS